MPERGRNNKNRDKSNQGSLFPSVVIDAMNRTRVVSVRGQLEYIDNEVRKLKQKIED